MFNFTILMISLLYAEGPDAGEHPAPLSTRSTFSATAFFPIHICHDLDEPPSINSTSLIAS